MARCFFPALVMAMLSFAAGSRAQSPASPESESGIDPAVSALVAAWGERQSEMGDRRVRVFDAFDEVRPDGQKLQYAHVRTVTVSPPNRLRIETRGDLAQRTFVYDGQTATLADHDHQAYGQLDFEGTVEEMIDHLFNEYGVTTPLADFLSSDPARDLVEGVTQAEVLGTGLVGETECIHIACRQELIDWQAWFGGDESSPQLLRLVITHKTLPLAPQYTLQVLDFEEIEATDADFAFEPEGMERLPFEPTHLMGSQPAASEE